MVLASGKRLRISWALGMHSHASGRRNTDLLCFTQAPRAGCFFNSKVAAPSRRHAWRRKARSQVQMIGKSGCHAERVEAALTVCAGSRTSAPDEVVLKDCHAVVHVRAALAVGEPVEEAPEAQALGLLLLLALRVLEVAEVCAAAQALTHKQARAPQRLPVPTQSHKAYMQTLCP